MEMKIGAETVNKALEAIANVSKTTANLTDAEKNKKELNGFIDTNNQQHQQTVEVHVGDTKDAPKPVIIKEKPETHIHKHFPDNRALTKDECSLEETRIKLDFEAKERERNFQKEMEEIRRKERKEREEYERAEARKARRIHGILGGILGVGFLAFAGYCVYTDSRNAQNRRIALPAAGETGGIVTEGKIE